MSGPRVTSGEDSRQDYGTPANLLSAIAHRFDPIQFDLAAHAANHKHARYFAPPELVETFEAGKTVAGDMMDRLTAAGGDRDEVVQAVLVAVEAAEAASSGKAKVSVKNHDPNAFGFDSFKFDWSSLRTMDPSAGPRWLLFLNCEFSDCEPWAAKFLMEAQRGADGVLLTPAALGSNWCRDHILGKADVYELNGRLCFDGKNVFPKDCMVTHFWPGMTGARHLWDWKRDKLIYSWSKVTEPVAAEPAPAFHDDRQGRLLG